MFKGIFRNGRDVMGIIRTNEWLKAEFDNPIKICEKLIPYFKELNAKEIYHELLNYGMYRPSRGAKSYLRFMEEQNTWGKVTQIFHDYKTKWSGPDIPIFLFPLAQSRGLFVRQESTKSGVSYPDKMFLFISDLEDMKELEALFVHEYHHICRLNKLKKKMNEFTLLDSIIIEGLAEYTVERNCGPQYLANWCTMYSEKEISVFWEKYIEKFLHRKKSERIHDEILYGGGRFPNLLGYAAGYDIVNNFYKNNHYSTKLSFANPAEKYLESRNNY